MRPNRSRALLLVAWALLSVLSAGLLHNSQVDEERDLKQRFENRTEVAANFTRTYVAELIAQERSVAERELSVGRDLEHVSKLFGNEAAVLLDSRGRALQVVPAAPSLIGRDLAARYDHLRAATDGRRAVSNVVPSAANGTPVVAFATPFASKHGRRVFSGAFDIATTPIGAFLRNATALKGARVYLIDSAGQVVASNRRQTEGLFKLSQTDPELAEGLSDSPSSRTSGDYEYSSERVGDTPWRLVMSVPAAQLFEPLHGIGHYIPWLLWGGFVLGALACVLLVAYLVQSRRELSSANERLDRLALVDDLTGLPNRRQAQVTLDAAISSAARHDQPLSVLMIDIDCFKEINDSRGHEAGDEVLGAVARAISGALRAEDLVGRWGGEEFLAILPDTNLDGVARVGERVRDAVAGTPVAIGDELVAVTVSVGAAIRVDHDSDALVASADAAMYLAKAAGRNAVRTA